MVVVRRLKNKRSFEGMTIWGYYFKKDRELQRHGIGNCSPLEPATNEPKTIVMFDG
jgi:hypothetical protein